jgi:L,D-transpeptidase YcbB
LGRRHVRANIAGFNVSLWNNEELVRTHLIIVGKPYRKTPIFSDEIEYMIFNPWWEVPNTIARKDKLPLFRQQPSLVNELGFQVKDGSGNILDSDTINWNTIRPGTFPYRLRQSPGEQNALGQVKIMFPNIHNVYLHDTPTRGLFANRQRAFSSGCMRTQDPLDLAAWLLEETPGWDKNQIAAAVASGEETRVSLTRRVPVHVLYFTAISEEHGGVRYLDDIYQRDAAVLAGLRMTADSPLPPTEAIQ